MRKSLILVLSLAVVIGFSVGLSSCKKDDEPVKYQLSFADTELTINEADGLIEITVTLDKPAPQDITIDYTVEGTAFEVERAEDENEYPDFAIENVGEVEIEQGETSGVINLELFSDVDIEDDETIVITITKVDAQNVDFTASPKIDITLKQEDGIVVILEWPEASTAGVADMDLLVRVGETASSVTYDGLIAGSIFRGVQYNYELVFIPKAYTGDRLGLSYTNTTYGLTYTYYDGDLDPLNFNAIFIDFIDGQGEPEADQQVFEGSYTLANINKWTDTYPTIIAQTFQNNEGVFSNISEIYPPQTTGSRSASNSKLNTMLKSMGRNDQPMNTRVSQKVVKQLGLH